MAPDKYDPNVVQGLLIQVRREAVGSNRTPLLDSMSVNIAAADIDIPYPAVRTGGPCAPEAVAARPRRIARPR